MRVLGKVWPVLGLVSVLVCACGGDDGSSISTQTSSVDVSGTGSGSGDGSTTVASTLNVNVSQVFTNWYSTPSSFTLSGQYSWSDQDGSIRSLGLSQAFKREPLSDAVLNGQVAKRSRLLIGSVWRDEVVFPDGDRGTVDYFSTEPFRFLGSEYSFTSQVDNGPVTKGVVRGVVQDAVAAPVGVKVGSTGSWGSATFIPDPEPSVGPRAYDVQEYSYSVEAAARADNAWVCQKTLVRNSKGRLSSENKFCLLSNANSEVLGLRFGSTEYDQNGLGFSTVTLQ